MKKRVLAGILAAGLVVSLSVFTYSEAVVSRSTALKTSVVNDTNAKKIVRENSAKAKQFKSQMQTLVDKYEKTNAKELDIAKQKLEIANNLDKILSSDKISDTQKAQIMQILDNLAYNEVNRGNNSGGEKSTGGGGFWEFFKKLCIDFTNVQSTCPSELGPIGGFVYNINWDIANGNNPIHYPWDQKYPLSGGFLDGGGSGDNGGGVSNGGSSGGGSGGSSGGGNYQPSPDVWKLSANNCKLAAGKCYGTGCTYRRYKAGAFMTADTRTNVCPSSCICPNELK